MTGRRRLGGQHPGQVGGAAGPGDDHPDPPPGRLLGVAVEQVRRAMGGHDPQLVRDAELGQQRRALLEDREVRAAPADDPDERSRVRAATLLALRLGERLDAVEDVELLDVGPAGVTGGDAGLELEQLGVDRLAAVDGDEPGAEQPDAVGA